MRKPQIIRTGCRPFNFSFPLSLPRLSKRKLKTPRVVVFFSFPWEKLNNHNNKSPRVLSLNSSPRWSQEFKALKKPNNKAGPSLNRPNVGLQIYSCQTPIPEPQSTQFSFLLFWNLKTLNVFISVKISFFRSVKLVTFIHLEKKILVFIFSNKHHFHVLFPPLFC